MVGTTMIDLFQLHDQTDSFYNKDELLALTNDPTAGDVQIELPALLLRIPQSQQKMMTRRAS